LEEGVVTRTVISAMPPYAEYALPPKGQALNSIFESLAEWAVTWMKPKGPEWVDPITDDDAYLAPEEAERRARRRSVRGS